LPKKEVSKKRSGQAKRKREPGSCKFPETGWFGGNWKKGTKAGGDGDQRKMEKKRATITKTPMDRGVEEKGRNKDGIRVKTSSPAALGGQE